MDNTLPLVYIFRISWRKLFPVIFTDEKTGIKIKCVRRGDFIGCFILGLSYLRRCFQLSERGCKRYISLPDFSKIQIDSRYCYRAWSLQYYCLYIKRYCM